MKAKPPTTLNGSSRHDARIDAALRVYSHAEPAPGLEGRVAAWISAMPRQSLRSAGASRLVVMWRFFAAALAVAAACAIVAGSVEHSHRAALPQAARVQHQGGVTTSGTAHVPTRSTPETPTIDPDAPRTPAHGRATVSRDQGRRDGGAAVPASPYPPSQQPANSPQ
jgi:hypothetical protein